MSVHTTEAVVSVLLFALLVPVLVLPWLHWQYRNHGRLSGWAAVVAGASVFYLCGVLAFTLFPLPSVTADFCSQRSVHDYLQLQPLASVRDVVVAGHGSVAGMLTSAAFLQVALNVLLFVPLGFLLRYRFGRGLAVTAGIGLAVSLLIEVTQGSALFGIYPCPYRVADVDDLISNTLGAVVGWGLARATTRALPAAVPRRVDDLDPPGLVRRGLALAGDLLAFFLAATTIGLVVTLAGKVGGIAVARDLAAGAGFGSAVDVVVVLAATLALPLARRDRATPGQWAFALALADAGTGGPAPTPAVWRRFAVWWFPVIVLAVLDRYEVVLVLAVVVGVAARLRTDRRSVLGLAGQTRTVTAAALRTGAVRLPDDARAR